MLLLLFSGLRRWSSQIWPGLEDGQGMVEYGLIIALVAVALIAVLYSLNGGISGIFNKAISTLNSATS